MGKIILWLVIIFAVLLGLRLYNSGKFKRRSDEAKPSNPADPTTNSQGEAMVRCARCGIYLPRSEAQQVSGQIRCRDSLCESKK